MNAMFSAHAGEGSRTLAHRPQRSRSRDTQSGENAEEESRYDGHPSDKQENGSVYRCILDARNIERHQSDDASQQGDGDENTERPPQSESAIDSTRSCRTIARRLAPMDTRKANSEALREPRAKS